MYKIKISKELWMPIAWGPYDCDFYRTLVEVSFMNKWDLEEVNRFLLTQRYPLNDLFQLSSSTIRYYDYETQSYIQTEYEKLPSNWYDGCLIEELSKYRQHNFRLDIDFNEFEINEVYFKENINNVGSDRFAKENPYNNIILELKHPTYKNYICLRFWNVSSMLLKYETVLKQEKQHWRLTDLHLGSGEDEAIHLNKRPLVFFRIDGLLSGFAEGVYVSIRSGE